MNNWTVTGDTLIFGPGAMDWCAFPGAAGAAVEIAVAHNIALAEEHQRAERAEADAAALRMAALEYDAAIRRHADKESWTASDDLDQLYARWLELARAGRADAALLAELAAARAVVAAALADLAATGHCPICSATIVEFGQRFDHADGCALAAYEATKGTTVSNHTNGTGDLASWKERAERAEAALEQLREGREGIETHADHVEPALDRIEANAAALGRQLWRGDLLVLAARIALSEFERDGQLWPHTHGLLRAAVAAWEPGRMQEAEGAALAGEQFVAEARAVAAFHARAERAEKALLDLVVWTSVLVGSPPDTEPEPDMEPVVRVSLRAARAALVSALGDATLRAAMERAAAPIAPSLKQLVDAARAAGARGIWIVRGMDAVALSWSDLPGSTALEHDMLLTPPHELVILIRFEAGDGGESGVEFRQ